MRYLTHTSVSYGNTLPDRHMHEQTEYYTITNNNENMENGQRFIDENMLTSDNPQPIEYWANMLSYEEGDELLYEYERLGRLEDRYTSLFNCLDGFSWAGSSAGEDYWDDIYCDIDNEGVYSQYISVNQFSYLEKHGVEDKTITDMAKVKQRIEEKTGSDTSVTPLFIVTSITFKDDEFLKLVKERGYPDFRNYIKSKGIFYPFIEFSDTIKELKGKADDLSFIFINGFKIYFINN